LQEFFLCKYFLVYDITIQIAMRQLWHHKRENICVAIEALICFIWVIYCKI